MGRLLLVKVVGHVLERIENASLVRHGRVLHVNVIKVLLLIFRLDASHGVWTAARDKSTTVLLC